ncbi:MAG: MBL fold metallo-hydrolase [Thermodesulfobacteriota bacterium]|nr:MBL fold metallo-hydrolase [Thermodesulfobacteriota bacterium]
MKPIEVVEDLFFIERGYLNGNHFVYKGKDPVLIDTAYISDFAETERLINQAGVDLCDVRLIVTTHCHCDHIGGNKIIQERSGCDIFLHKAGKRFMDRRDSWSTWWDYYDQEAAFFEPTKALEDGDVVAAGPHAFEVIHTPGHAADGIVLYDRKEKVLISSDTLWEKEMAVMTLPIEGSSALQEMLDSLERIASLDVDVVFPGHGRPFTDVDEALSQSRNRIRGFIDHPRKVGLDVLKKIIIYTLMMRRAVDENNFFASLMEGSWFKDTIDLYFEGEYAPKYDETMQGLMRREVVRRKEGKLFTIVRP